MLGLKQKLGDFYKYIRYGIRTTRVGFVSTIVECQDPITMDTYNCENCAFNVVCFLEEKPRFVTYLKRGNRYY